MAAAPEVDGLKAGMKAPAGWAEAGAVMAGEGRGRVTVITWAQGQRRILATRRGLSLRVVDAIEVSLKGGEALEADCADGGAESGVFAVADASRVWRDRDGAAYLAPRAAWAVDPETATFRQVRRARLRCAVRYD